MMRHMLWLDRHSWHLETRALSSMWGKELKHKNLLTYTCADCRTIEAIRLVLKQWTNRRHGVMSLRLIQMLRLEDTAQHKLKIFSAWIAQRVALSDVVRDDFLLPTTMKEMIGNEEPLRGDTNVLQKIMPQLEAVEQKRKDGSLL
ncbi:hypothetical protein EVAR_80061_1 [Eumeta japonica]|uniref:Uncharacterized protein n=1 Tax=Eumeta variegata TaxID=151549 RepID=A0A4C1WKI8_EUMVA|nr:hypothetical protein EVAR_80061_1 [Eumeta japonica]